MRSDRQLVATGGTGFSFVSATTKDTLLMTEGHVLKLRLACVGVPRTLHNHLKRGYGSRLRRARVEAGLSQRALAFPGCTAAYISRIEAGARFPSMQMMHELAERLNVDPHWLATGEKVVVRADLRAQLQAARIRIRQLESKLEAVAQIVRD